ncbi:MAG: IIA-like nitrogen-regulatory protein PtsN [Pseudomonadota bacterium]|jgi:PTS system nitrogen regulatory IIA component
MSLLANLLNQEDVLLTVDAPNKKRLFETVASAIESHHGLSASVVNDSLHARERLGSTGLGEGIAIPHGRIKGLQQAIGLFVRPKLALPFDSPDGRAVDQIFVLLVPQQATDHHLLILSELAQKFSDKNFREQLRACTDPQGVVALFAN